MPSSNKKPKKPSHKKSGSRVKLAQKPTVSGSAIAFQEESIQSWTPDEIQRVGETVWDQTTPGKNCAVTNGQPPLPKEDCNCFIKNSCRQFISTLSFDNLTFNADDILRAVSRADSGWTALGANPDSAVSAVSEASVVIAGLSSAELEDSNGHLALVVTGTEFSGTWSRSFPRCIAGSVNSGARVKDRGVQFTFPVKKAPSVRYFSRKPDVAVPNYLLKLSAEVELR